MTWMPTFISCWQSMITVRVCNSYARLRILLLTWSDKSLPDLLYSAWDLFGRSRGSDRTVAWLMHNLLSKSGKSVSHSSTLMHVGSIQAIHSLIHHEPLDPFTSQLTPRIIGLLYKDIEAFEPPLGRLREVSSLFSLRIWPCYRIWTIPFSGVRPSPVPTVQNCLYSIRRYSGDDDQSRSL